MTISPDLLEELQNSEGEVPRKLDPDAATRSAIEKLDLDEKSFRYLLNEDAMAMEVHAASRIDPLYAYPDKSDTTTAQAWNEVAAKNNRIVIFLEPQSR